MTLRLKGTITNTTCDGIEYPDEMEGGWSALYKAIALWDLVGSTKGRTLFHLLKNEIEVPDDGLRVMTRPQIMQVLDLLQDVGKDAQQITDEYWHVRPQALDRVILEVPDLVASWQEDDHTIYSLANVMMQVFGVEFFLKGAICLNRDVELD